MTIPAAPPHKAGARVREQLLEAAGLVFAEKGYDRSTSKEICERAGMCSSAVNYHFGGFDPLYTAVLARSHERLFSMEEVREIVSTKAKPQDKLKAFLLPVIRRLLSRSDESWEIRLFCREMLAPTPARDQFVTLELLPKIDVLREIIGEYLGVPPEEPVVVHSLLSVFSPCLILAITQRTGRLTFIPEFKILKAETESLAENLLLFISAGLDAVAKSIAKAPNVPDYRDEQPGALRA